MILDNNTEYQEQFLHEFQSMIYVTKLHLFFHPAISWATKNQDSHHQSSFLFRPDGQEKWILPAKDEDRFLSALSILPATQLEAVGMVC